MLMRTSVRSLPVPQTHMNTHMCKEFWIKNKSVVFPSQVSSDSGRHVELHLVIILIMD